MDSSNGSCNGISPEVDVQVAFPEEGVGLSLTGDGEVKLVNQRKSAGGEEVPRNADKGCESNKSSSKRGELQGNDSMKLLDVFRPSEAMKSCRPMRSSSMRFHNSKLCNSGELDLHIKKDPLAARSDHGPAALSTYWMATRSPSDNFYDENKCIDTGTVSTADSSVAQETPRGFEDESDGRQTTVTKVAMEELSAEDAAQFDGQGSFSIHPTSDEEEQEQVSPSKAEKRDRRSSSKSARNSRKERRASRSKGGSSAQHAKRRSSDGELLHRSCPTIVNNMEQNEKDGGATPCRSSKRKPARRQRSKSLTAAQPQILKSKARGEEFTKPGISRERLRALSRRASMDTAPANQNQNPFCGGDEAPRRLHSSFSMMDDSEIVDGVDPQRPGVNAEGERSRRCQRRTSKTRHEQDKRGSSRIRQRSSSSRPTEERKGSSRTCHRSKSKREGSRRLQRMVSEGQSPSKPYQRSSTVTGASASKPMLVDQGVLRRTKTETIANRGRPNRSTSIDRADPTTGQTPQPSADPRRPRRRGSTGVAINLDVGVDRRSRSTSKTRTGSAGKHNGRSTSQTRTGGAGKQHGKEASSSRHSRSHRRLSGQRLQLQQSELIISHSNLCEYEDISEPDARSRSASRSRKSDGFDRLSFTDRQKKIVDALKSIGKDPEAPTREAVVYDAGWKPRQQALCQTSGVTMRQKRRSSMGATATSSYVAGLECSPSRVARKEKRRSSMGMNLAPEPRAEPQEAGSHRAAGQSSGMARREKRRSSMGLKKRDKEAVPNDYGYDYGLNHNSEHQPSGGGVARREKYKRRFSTH